MILLLVGCESGLSVAAQIIVPEEVAAESSVNTPGLLRASADGWIVEVAPVCGEALPRPVEVSWDLGFGCLDERGGGDTMLAAWVEPVPADWDAAGLCALTRENVWETLDVEGVRGDTPLADGPDVTWPKGAGAAPWERDLSPCGGRAEGLVQVSR